MLRTPLDFLVARIMRDGDRFEARSRIVPISRLRDALSAPSGLRILLGVCAALLWANQGAAQSIADFYARTPVRLIVSADPGGSYDQIGRLVSRHIGRHIPGSPRVVPENMLGASGRAAANFLYRTGPQDGSVIGVIQQSIPMGQALGETGVQYDASRFNWIGSPVRLDETLVVWHTAGVRTIEDARQKSVIIGATSPTGMNYVYPKLANEFLGTKFKIVTGYPGGTPIVLALERGEVEGRGSNPWSEWKATKPDWVREGKIIALMQMSLFKHPDLPHVPLMMELAPNETVRAIFELVSIVGEIGRPFVTGPGVPPERVAALREAFRKTMIDPEFLADAAKTHIDIHPIFGDELEQLVKRVLNSPKSATDLLKAALAKN
jgi:tripartite-type tricarboxylate transporter receptor subunit TctC